MRSILLVIGSFAITILAWGIYGPVLHWGQSQMSTMAGSHARLRPFVCVGLAYFVIGVLVPGLVLKLKGEQGQWTLRGLTFSLAGGALGAVGALGIILAFNFGGNATYVMPLVFGGAPVVNAFLTIYLGRRMKEIGPLFLTGLTMVLLGAVTVFVFAPRKDQLSADHATAAASDTRAESGNAPQPELVGNKFSRFVLQLLSIAVVILCWGSYGPVLHHGQAAMHHSRLRPLICVGLAYFAIAVVVPNLLLVALPEESTYSHLSGTMWSLGAGAAGAIGALGIILAFNFGGKPVYVMPLVFGGAPVVNTLFTAMVGHLWDRVHPFFLSGLILVIAGAAMVLVFAPRPALPGKVEGAVDNPS
ncbi:MAG: hypothetical protein MK171_08825 [Pirellulales bacterium]|nr:hypothetical protein [Pirellulales bacterium]